MQVDIAKPSSSCMAPISPCNVILQVQLEVALPPSYHLTRGANTSFQAFASGTGAAGTTSRRIIVPMHAAMLCTLGAQLRFTFPSSGVALSQSAKSYLSRLDFSSSALPFPRL